MYRVQILHEGRLVFAESISGLKQKGASLEEIFVRHTMNSRMSSQSMTLC